MGNSVNKVILVGNVGRDPDQKTGPSGNPFYCFSLATSETWNDRASGERRQRTEWHKIVVFADRCRNICENYIRKGTKLYIEGKIKTRSWTDADGKEQYTTEIVVDNFGGDITMVGGRGSDQGDGGYDEDGGADGGSTYGGRGRSALPPRGGTSFGTPSSRSPSPSSQRTFGDLDSPGRSGGQSSNGWDTGDGDLDDEIPF